MTIQFAAHTLNPERYAETFSVFVSRSHEYSAMLQRLVATGNACPEGFACLDVGAGTGMLLRDWLARKGRQPERYVAIEPNEKHAVPLRETVAELGLPVEILTQPFHPEFPQPGSFDLILFSHSLYWMRNPVACLRHAYTWLKTGGFLLVFLQGPFGFHSLFHLYNPLLSRDYPIGPDHGLSSHELMQGLRADGFAPVLTFDSTMIELTGIFDEGAEQTRDEFISFLLQVEFAQLTEPLKSDFIQCLRAACVENDDRLLLHHPGATIRICRTEK